MAAAIVTERLGKRYLLGERADAYGALRDALGGLVGRGSRAAREELWALRDVDLEVERGEVVGIIGRNGAGKTTLLKLIARITEPTEGTARMRGRVGALLEVGTGFHFELTGRENIFFNGAVLGMSRQEIRRRFDQIVDFAGVERFLDTPLKRYSAGMYLRLAFSVAAHLDPDIVIVDEVLAVGDTEFQRRCLARMSELGGEGRTVMFVSHDLGAIGRLCGRVVWIDQGRVVADGSAAEVLDHYQRVAAVTRPSARVELPDEPASAVQFRSAVLLDERGRELSDPRRDQPLTIKLEFISREPVRGLDVGVVVLDRRGLPIVRTAASDDSGSRGTGSPGRYRASVTIPGILSAGEYLLRGWIGGERGVITESDLLRLRLRPRFDESHRPGPLRLLHPSVRWSVKPLQDEPAGR
jgi:ABC-type polysaccharide/polyol phosphate transport system ATPase subunit